MDFLRTMLCLTHIGMAVDLGCRVTPKVKEGSLLSGGTWMFKENLDEARETLGSEQYGGAHVRMWRVQVHPSLDQQQSMFYGLSLGSSSSRKLHFDCKSFHLCSVKVKKKFSF